MIERWLDNCLGACELRCPDVAQVVADSLLFFHGERYLMGDFVVMPNHVHLLIVMLGTFDLRRHIGSWTRYSACRINRLLGRTGALWLPESFDHIVRSPEQYEYLRRYIEDNPSKAGLPVGDYLLHRADF